MKNRDAVYLAFNGCGAAVPTKSDVDHYNLLKGWDANPNPNININFIDSHDKVCRARDDILTEELKLLIKEKLKKAKIILLVVTKNTVNQSEILKYELSEAIDKLKLPLIVAYTDIQTIKSANEKMRKDLPLVIQERIKKSEVKIMFIPFKLDAIRCAMKIFSIDKVKDINNGVYVYKNIETWD